MKQLKEEGTGWRWIRKRGNGWEIRMHRVPAQLFHSGQMISTQYDRLRPMLHSNSERLLLSSSSLWASAWFVDVYIWTYIYNICMSSSSDLCVSFSATLTSSSEFTVLILLLLYVSFTFQPFTLWINWWDHESWYNLSLLLYFSVHWFFEIQTTFRSNAWHSGKLTCFQPFMCQFVISQLPTLVCVETTWHYRSTFCPDESKRH